MFCSSYILKPTIVVDMVDSSIAEQAALRSPSWSINFSFAEKARHKLKYSGFENYNILTETCVHKRVVPLNIIGFVSMQDVKKF